MSQALPEDLIQELKEQFQEVRPNLYETNLLDAYRMKTGFLYGYDSIKY